MKLSNTAIEGMAGRQKRLQLALALNFTEIWIDKLFEKNKNNGPLTTAKALEVIKQETGLAESEILEESTEPEKVS